MIVFLLVWRLGCCNWHITKSIGIWPVQNFIHTTISYEIYILIHKILVSRKILLKYYRAEFFYIKNIDIYVLSLNICLKSYNYINYLA